MSLNKARFAVDKQRIGKIKAELEISTPEASGSGWDASAELAEVEKLADMGVVLSRQPSSRKGKGKAVAGHLVFTDNLDTGGLRLLPSRLRLSSSRRCDYKWR